MNVAVHCIACLLSKPHETRIFFMIFTAKDGETFRIRGITDMPTVDR